MQAIILAVGDELVLGQTPDTNSAYLSAELVKRGIGTLYHQTVADDREAIAGAIRQAAQHAGLVIVTGGLGPTEDDLTRQGLADALGIELVVDPPSLEQLRGYFRGRLRPMPKTNEVQALCPRGAAMIPNSCGTAPGISARLGQAAIFVTPGVPSEMFAMFERSILPRLDALAPTRGVILTAKVNTFGLGESAVGERLGTLMDRARNPKVGTTVAGGIVAVRVRSEFPAPEQAQKELHATLAAVEQALGSYVYGRDEATLQESVVGMLMERGLTLATAESCTGGMLGAAITDVPGASDVYLGGWVTYANAMKQGQLGVPPEMLGKHGAVSRETAEALARAAVERSGASLGVSITGVAGPGGGTPEKPVGLVWVGIAQSGQVVEWSSGQKESGRVEQPSPGMSPRIPGVSESGSVVEWSSGQVKNSDTKPSIWTDAVCLDLAWSRTRAGIRDRAVKSALQLLRFHLRGVPLDELMWARRLS